MKAMIMAAGVGSRLMPLTIDIPKPMIPMANRPLMENIVELLTHHGFDQIIANLHYHADRISEYFLDGSLYGANMVYSRESELMGTAGGVKKCAWFLDEAFVIVSGDALTDANLTYLIQEHKKKGALATIALKEVQEVEQFGIVITDDNGKINSFQEKPQPHAALSNTANTGIYIFEPEIFSYIPANEFYDFGKQVFPHLVKIGAPFFGINITDYWCDVGNLATYQQAHADILEGRINLVPGGKMITGRESRVLLGEGAKISDDVDFKGNCIIGPGCRIAGGAVIDNTIIWSDSVIKDQAVLRNCIVGAGCRIGASAQIGSGAVAASGCIIQDSQNIPAQSKVFTSAGELIIEL